MLSKQKCLVRWGTPAVMRLNAEYALSLSLSWWWRLVPPHRMRECVCRWMDHFSPTSRRKHCSIHAFLLHRSTTTRTDPSSSLSVSQYPRIHASIPGFMPVYRIADAHWDAAGKRDSCISSINPVCLSECYCAGLIDCRCCVSEVLLWCSVTVQELKAYWSIYTVSSLFLVFMLMLCVGSAHVGWFSGDLNILMLHYYRSD